jgi:hypothetical protein
MPKYRHLPPSVGPLLGTEFLAVQVAKYIRTPDQLRAGLTAFREGARNIAAANEPGAARETVRTMLLLARIVQRTLRRVEA